MAIYAHVNKLLCSNAAHGHGEPPGAEAARTVGGATQSAFARKLGISQATLARLESAAQNTTVKTLQQISKALRCDVGDLFKK